MSICAVGGREDLELRTQPVRRDEAIVSAYFRQRGEVGAGVGQCTRGEFAP